MSDRTDDFFVAGRLKLFVYEWKKLTSDPVILDMVQNCHIEINENIFELEQGGNKKFPTYQFNSIETEAIDNEISKLLKLQVIKLAKLEPDSCVSPIFVRPKKNGEYRMILNLQKLNSFVQYHHFKMDTFEKALNLITKGTWMASIDLRHAYYSVPVAEEHQKYLCFMWKNKLYQYTCFPNGLASCPRQFTKLMKPVFSKLRNMGHVNSGFIDDSLLCGDTLEECQTNVNDTKTLMSNLGFTINNEKSVFEPTQKMIFLGHTIDSENMIVQLPQHKVDHIKSECTNLLARSKASIRHVAKVIGVIVASFSAVEFGKLHYRGLEKAKTCALKRSYGNYDGMMGITPSMRNELKWWYQNIDNQCRHISHGNPAIEIQTDSSLLGWGVVCQGQKIGGRWTRIEKTYHINVLELLAIKFAMKALSDKVRNKHVLVLSDSSTAVCYVNNMGGIKSDQCNNVASEIWQLANECKTWISCSHIPGKTNEADHPSRNFNDQLEWELCNEVFLQLCNKWQKPNIDLFATRLNKKLPLFCAWKPDPEAAYFDAFTVDWAMFDVCYIFCPFSILARVVQKIRIDKARGIIVAPLWPTQPWFTLLMRTLVDYPVILPSTKKLLRLQHSDMQHPLAQKMVMIACKVSGDSTDSKAFLDKLPMFSCPHGESRPNVSTKCILKNGYSTVVSRKSIKFQFL